MRGLGGGKFNELCANLKLLNKNFSFIILTEVWLHKITDVGFCINGYKSISLLRENRRGGGIKIYYDDNINICKVDNLTVADDICERLFIRATIPGFGNLLLGAVYRPPNFNVFEFINFIDSFLESEANSRLVITGDINIDVLKSCPNVQLYKDTITQNGFLNEINIPTYHSPITNSDVSCLDHFIHNLNSCRTKSLILTPTIADHYATALLIERKIETKKNRVS